MTGLFWSGLIVLCLQPGRVTSLFEAKWLRWIGTISYGMYIYHWLFRGFYDWVATKIRPSASTYAHDGIRFGVTMVLTTVISWVSFRVFESPISRLKRYF